MLKVILFSTSLFAFLFQGLSQEIVTTTGEYAIGTQGSLSWTIGEPITETVTATANKFTQGFQQDFENFVGISEIYQSDQFLIYPNPFLGELIIQSNIDESEYHIIIHDAQFKLIRDIKLSLPQGIANYTLDLSMLTSGLYFITLEIGEAQYPITQQIIKLDEIH